MGHALKRLEAHGIAKLTRDIRICLAIQASTPDVACFLFEDDAIVIDPQAVEIDDLGFAFSGRVLSNKYIVSNADGQQCEANIKASSVEKRVLWLNAEQLQCHYPRY